LTYRHLVPTAILVIASLSGSYFYLQGLWQQAITLEESSRVLTINSGESLHQVLSRAETQGWLMDANWVGRIARWQGLDQKIQMGEFRIANGMTAGQMIEHLATGQVVQYKITIPEGVTLRAAIALLERHPKLAATAGDKLNVALAAWVSPAISPEGWFLPETWSFTAGDADTDILRRAHTAMRELLDSLWGKRAVSLPLASPYEALILASIVERETAAPSERSQIAGVFLRRLERGMRLQTDPTVIYGLGDTYDGNLRRTHLRDPENAYNTYVIRGLPPTPIALPGEDALRAVFNPDDSDALYFVAKGDGTHAFSASLEEHEENVRRYQLVRRSDYRSTPDSPKQRRQ
jgi:UPF0755 protein